MSCKGVASCLSLLVPVICEACVPVQVWSHQSLWSHLSTFLLVQLSLRIAANGAISYQLKMRYRIPNHALQQRKAGIL